MSYLIENKLRPLSCEIKDSIQILNKHVKSGIFMGLTIIVCQPKHYLDFFGRVISKENAFLNR